MPEPKKDQYHVDRVRRVRKDKSLSPASPGRGRPGGPRR